jgi:hypothetical protein
MVFQLRTLSPKKISLGKQEDNSLRKRADKDEGERKEADELNHKKCEENGSVSASDPVKWFGYLVPQNLRHAQRGFHVALELVVQSANIQSELEATCKRFDKLLKVKTTLATIKS